MKPNFTKKALFGLAILCVPSTALAGPFGLEMGLMPDDVSVELSALPPQAHPTHSSKTAPVPNKLFNSYLYKFGETGLCSVRGVGEFTLSDEVGEDGVSSKSDKVIDLLRAKYGEPAEINKFAISNVEPSGVMWGVKGNHLHYSVEWKLVGPNSLPNNLQSIYLSSSAKTQTSAVISIDYSFTNYPDCSRQLDGSSL